MRLAFIKARAAAPQHTRPMTKRNIIQKWIPSLVTTLALTGFATLCHAQSPITYTFDSDVQGWGSLGGGGTYTWDATDGNGGGGCLKVVFDGTTTTEIDPGVTLPAPLNTAQYLNVTVDIKVDPASGTTGTGGSGGYGNLQAVFRDASFSWDSMWYGTLFSQASSGWITYTFTIPNPYNSAEKTFQFQLQGNASTGYSAPVTVYIDNVRINPVSNPYVLEAFTNNATAGSSWDSTVDAPYRNPVTGASSTISPSGSWELVIPNPGSYTWNQLGLGSPFDTTRFQYIGFDIYLDGSSGSTYGGVQLIFFKNNYAGTPNTVTIGPIPFNASMVGKWTHFDLPCSSSGITACPAIVFQSTPGSDGGTDTTTLHIDNIQLWNPVFVPSITSVSKGTAGGVQMTLDANGNNNIYDQEGISSPATNNNGSTDYFWVNQTPATYAFTLTNFPSPAAAPQLDAHIYVDNGDSLVNWGNTNPPGGNGANLWNYNQTYSGTPYNMLDYLGLHVQNGTNGGVVAIVDWKENTVNANATNQIVFSYPTMASANGTWMLTFSDNTHGSVIANDGSVSNFTVPDFQSDPNYTGNFTPISSMVQFGIAKNGNITNNNQTFTVTSVAVTNSSTTLFDNFAGPGLTANNDWQVAEYYQFQAVRAIWQPFGTAYWLKWNTSAGGWSVQSSSNLLNWGSSGVSYTYSDGGTNTLGAVPSTNLPAGNQGFFRLVK